MDGDVVSDTMSSYMMWITCILREIKLMALVSAIYIGYTEDMNFTCMIFFLSDLVKINKLIEETPIEYLITLYKNM